MRKSIRALAVTSTIAAGLAAAPTLYAHDPEGSGGSMMGSGMMGQGGMMNMMGQMNEMMETCNEMMRGAAQQPVPKTPEEGTVPENEE